MPSCTWTWLVLACAAACGPAVAPRADAPGKPWADRFDEKDSDLVSTGRNTYWVLEPGYTLELEGAEKGKKLRLVVSVLPETRQVAGVETRVVEERETLDGQVVEVSRNYFASSKRTGNIYYFGEDVDEYKNGKVAGHGGSWHAGEKGARFGLIMPAKPQPGDRYYQEVAPKVAMDRMEIVSVTEKMKTAAGAFDSVLKTEETTPLEPDTREYKYYAPGVGLIQDGAAKLVRYGKNLK